MEETKAGIFSRSGSSWTTAVSSIGTTDTQDKKQLPPPPPPAEVLPTPSSLSSHFPQKSHPSSGHMCFGWQDPPRLLVYLEVHQTWMVLPLNTQGPPFCFGYQFRTGGHHFMAGSCHFVKYPTAVWLADGCFLTSSYPHVLRQACDSLARPAACPFHCTQKQVRKGSHMSLLLTMPFPMFSYCIVIGWQPMSWHCHTHILSNTSVIGCFASFAPESAQTEK